VARYEERCGIIRVCLFDMSEGKGRILQPLDISVWKWDSIAMDFVTYLP